MEKKTDLPLDKELTGSGEEKLVLFMGKALGKSNTIQVRPHTQEYLGSANTVVKENIRLMVWV